MNTEKCNNEVETVLEQFRGWCMNAMAEDEEAEFSGHFEEVAELLGKLKDDFRYTEYFTGVFDRAYSLYIEDMGEDEETFAEILGMTVDEIQDIV